MRYGFGSLMTEGTVGVGFDIPVIVCFRAFHSKFMKVNRQNFSPLNVMVLIVLLLHWLAVIQRQK